MLIVREQDNRVVRYVHMGTGNYNEDTAKLYTDISLISSRVPYAEDVSEFFNVITGHSKQSNYQTLVTAPSMMRKKLIELIDREIESAKAGLPSGIVIKVNSLQDSKIIDKLYDASEYGVPVRLIVRGICCLRPQREGLSENIRVYSIVGNFLEHSRVYYFHDQGDYHVWAGSADIMVRSFDRRIESLFEIVDKKCKKEMLIILSHQLRDNVNRSELLEDGTYVKMIPKEGEESFDCHKNLFNIKTELEKDISQFRLF